MTKTRQHLSFSALKAFKQSPNHLLAYDQKEFAPSAAMNFGTAFHCYLLESEKFYDRYYVGKVDRRTTKGKETAKAIELSGKILLSDADFSRIKSMSARCAEFTLPNQREIMVGGEINGVEFKGFVDAMDDQSIVDVKTCQDSSPIGFQRQVFNHGYHMQAAIYAEITGVDDVYFLAVESASPYNAVMHKVSNSLLELGKSMVDYYTDEWKSWDGLPMGYGSQNVLTIPSWAK